MHACSCVGHALPTAAYVRARLYAGICSHLTFSQPDHKANCSSVAWNVVLPLPPSSEAIYVNGQKLGPAASRSGAPSIQLAADSTIVVRSAGAAIGARISCVDGLAGYQPTFALHFDGPNGTAAGRLTAYLYKGPGIVFGDQIPKSSRACILLSGSRTPPATADEDSVALSQSIGSYRIQSTAVGGFNGSTWNATATPGTGTMPPRNSYGGLSSSFGVGLWLPRNHIIARTVNGTAMAMPKPGALELRYSNGSTETLTPSSFVPTLRPL